MSSAAISSPSPPTSSGDSEKASSEHPSYPCTTPGCSQTFTSSSDLAVHKQKHQMTLKLGPSKTGLADMLPFDQTPTPTKFLQLGKEVGLFDEISNPFDHEFKRGTSSGSMKEKARRSAVPGLIINNGITKARTPTSYPSSQIGMHAPVAQPVHVITLTPTLSSPVGALPGSSQFFIPPLPSPQGFIPNLAGLSATSPLAGPATLISPSIVPFSAPGLPFPTMQAVVEAQQAALTQAFINAAAGVSAASSHTANHNTMPVLDTISQGHIVTSRTALIPAQATATPAPFPTQTVSVPVHHGNHNDQQPSHLQPGPNIAAVPVGSASVIQQHGQISLDQSRRSLTQSNSLDIPNQSIPSNLERKASFPGETSVITQAPNSSGNAQINSNMNLNQNSLGYQYMGPQQTNLPQYSQSMGVDRPPSVSRMATHPILSSSRSAPTSQGKSNMGMQNIPNLNLQNSLPSMDTKQKLKETLTNNNPNLQMDLPAIKFDMDDKTMNEVSSSSGNDGKMPGRRRGRQQSEVDPDKKRMRFLERNRAAASRCRAKKKQWVSGLEVKAKELNMSNINLQNEVASLREEVASLKQLLLAHRDCPITRIQHQKLVIAGADPSSVVSNPVQAAASLLGLSSEDTKGGDAMLESSTVSNMTTTHQPLSYTSSAGSLTGDDSQSISQGMVGKTEPVDTSFPTANSQPVNTSTIVLNSSYSNSNSSLSSSNST